MFSYCITEHQQTDGSNSKIWEFSIHLDGK